MRMSGHYDSVGQCGVLHDDLGPRCPYFPTSCQQPFQFLHGKYKGGSYTVPLRERDS